MLGVTDLAVRSEEGNMKLTNKLTGVCLLTASTLFISDVCISAQNISAQPEHLPRAGQTVLTYQDRLYLNAPPFPPTVVRAAFYFTDVAGVPGPIVEPTSVDGEIKAYFTAVYDNPGAEIVANGDVSTAVFVPGQKFKVYFNPSTYQTWDDPDTFAAGELVATFESSIGISATAAVSAPPAPPSQAPPPFSVTAVTQTYTLKWSKDFVFQGKTYNFRHLIPNGFTNGGGVGGNANLAVSPAFPIVSAGAGCFVAIGGPWSALPPF
jgi:hypothetical protein